MNGLMKLKLPLLLALMIHLGHCCMNNFDSFPPKIWRKYKGMYATNIFIAPKQPLRNWTLKLEFQQPLVNSVKPSKGLIESENKEKSIVVLRSKDKDSFVRHEDQIILSVTFHKKIDGAVIRCAEFCGYLGNSEENICQMKGDLEKRGRKKKRKSSKKRKNKGKNNRSRKNRYMFDEKTTPICLNNFVYSYRTQWHQGRYWYTSANIKPNFKYPIKDWFLRMEFAEPLAQNIDVWNAQADSNTVGKKSIILKAKHWNTVLRNLNLDYHVAFRKKQGENHLLCAEFCGIELGTGRKICQNEVVTTQPTTTTTTTPPGQYNCLDNIVYHYRNQWSQGRYWRTSATIKPNFKYPLKDWSLRMEFAEPLAQNIAVWNADAVSNTKGHKSIILRAKNWNKVLDNLILDYQVTFSHKQGRNHLLCAEFCGKVPGTVKNICEKKSTTTPPTTTTSSTTTTTTTPTTTTTTTTAETKTTE